MQNHPTAASSWPEGRAGVLVADGWGLAIHVHQGHLIVEDGRGSDRRTRRFNRATHVLRRLLVLGRGFITFEAVSWCVDAGVAVIYIGRDGRVLATSSSLGLDHPGLRRAQALAALRPIGLEITRSILQAKITGQANVAASIAGPEAGAQVASWLPQLEAAGNLEQMRLAEAIAASAFFDVWAQVPVRFPAADRRRVPDHWVTVGPRRSPISGKAQTAASPANATLNYLYALLEAEARIACFTVGLDPGIGILHADVRSRDSLALDLMEAVRPQVDAWLVRLLQTHVFRTADFHETPQGGCRVLRPLPHELAATTATWAEHLAPITEQVVRQLADTAPRPIRTSTPLTRANLKAAIHRRENPPQAARAQRPPEPTPHCQECGTPIEPPHKRCMHCHSEYLTTPDHPRLTQLATLRAEGHDPAHGGDAAHRRGRTNARHVQQAIAWEHNHPRPDPEEFRRDILPGLRHCSPQKMADATGLSYPYCTLIRTGQRTPHPRHWDALRTLT